MIENHPWIPDEPVDPPGDAWRDAAWRDAANSGFPAAGDADPALHAPGLEAAEALMERLVAGDRRALLGAMATDHLATGGRRMRARLALGAAAALGMSPEPVAPWAAAVELLHNATLIHDDLQDGDRIRRGRPTVWAQHGMPQAINAGDLLLILPIRAIAALQSGPRPAPAEVCWRLASALTRAAEETVRGQSLEMELRPARRLSFADWERAAAGKTGALLGLPVEGAALLRGLSDRTAASLSACFARIGLIYQMGDDVSDCFGRKGREGRGQPGSDLREGKVSALVSAHLALHPGDTADLLALLDLPREQTPEDRVGEMIARFERGGALRAVRDRMDRLGREVLADPTLTAIPDLRRVAAGLVALVETI